VDDPALIKFFDELSLLLWLFFGFDIFSGRFGFLMLPKGERN